MIIETDAATFAETELVCIPEVSTKSRADNFSQDISTCCASQISDRPFTFDKFAGLKRQTGLQLHWGTSTGCP
jgi:hypothetical protein